MTDSLNGPNIAARIDRLVRRIEDLERRLRARSTERPAPEPPLEAVFSHSGTPTTSASGRWYPRRTATLGQVFASRTAGTTSCVVTVYVNGGSQGTVTISGTGLTGTGTFDDVLVGDTDYVTVAATTVGTGTTDLTVQARLT